MNKTVNLFLALCAMLLISACSWVDDDLSKCPKGNWLKLSYAYNILNVDAAATQVGNVTLFVFKQDGTFVQKEEVDSVSLHENGCMVRVPDLPEGDYDFLIWGGLDDKYNVTLESIELLRDENNENSAKLKPLFQGRLDGVHITEDYCVHHLYLSKLTNVFSCLFQSDTEGFLDVQNDYRIEIKSHNSCVNHRNSLAGTDEIIYLPFMRESSIIEDLEVVHTGLNTMRLIENDNTRLTMTYIPTGKKIIDIPLTDYLLLSRNVDFMTMDPQEYLDREDRYNLIFFLSKSDKPDNPPYICAQIRINNWIVRNNEAELESSTSPYL